MSEKFNKFSEVYDKIVTAKNLPQATTQEEWVAAYYALKEAKTALANMINGDPLADVTKIY